MLEIYIGLLMKAMCYKIVECGGSRGDEGIDIRATLSFDTFQSLDVIIQCQQYSDTLSQADRARGLLGSMLISETNLEFLCRVIESLKDVGKYNL